ncbi:hypothetical protein ABFT23_01835 [Nocardioides sp. C4-1]|uniref:hypothetical protein n=1 Tax=Nocardioides sp. C4-1 TaxID=3151851 RepID=UPI003262D7EB
MARAGGRGALVGLPVVLVSLLAVAGHAEAHDVELRLLPAALTATGCATVGAAVLVASRAAGGRSSDPAPPQLGPEHDDPAGSALRRQQSWLSTALVVGLLPLVVALLMPRLEPGIRRPLTPDGQYTGRLVLAVVLAVLGVVLVVVALAAARRAEQQALEAVVAHGAARSDDVRAAVLALRPAALVRVGIAACGGAHLLAVGALLAPVLGAAAPAVGLVGAVGVLALGARGSAADLGALDAVRRVLTEER